MLLKIQKFLLYSTSYLASAILPLFTNQYGVSLQNNMLNEAGRQTDRPKISLHILHGRKAVIVYERKTPNETPITWKVPIMGLTEACTVSAMKIPANLHATLAGCIIIG